MLWCEDKLLVSGIFALETCSADSKAYCSLVCKFIGDENTKWKPTEVDKRGLQYVLNVLNLKTKSNIFIKWMEKYKCALIARLYQGCHQKQMRYISLVGLYQWNLHVNTSDENVRVKTSLSEGYSYTTSNPIENDQIKKFMKFFDIIKDNFEAKIGDDEYKGHVKTPAFIENVLKNAHIRLKDDKAAISSDPCRPSDGWSEVTQHLGCNSWPLVSAVCKHLFSFSPSSIETDVDILHRLFLCHFELWLLEKQLVVSSSFISNPQSNHSCVEQHVNLLMKMLTSVAKKVAHIPETKHDDMHFLYKECLMIRKKLDKLIMSRCKDISNIYTIKLHYIGVPIKPTILLKLPTQIEKYHSKGDIENDARNNIVALPLAIANRKYLTDLSEFLKWTKLFQEPRIMGQHMVLSTIETFIFSISKDLITSGHREIQIELLEELVFLYRRHLNEFLNHVSKTETGDHRSMLRVEIFSKETLIVWIIYCVIHKFLKSSIPLIQKFGVALEWKDIRYFALSNKEAITASLAVSEYLKSNTNEMPLFSLSKQDATFQFAVENVRQSDEINSIWQKEIQHANDRTDVHWKKVQGKQAVINGLEIELDCKKRELNQKCFLRTHSNSLYDTDMESKLLKDIVVLNAEVKSLVHKIQDERHPPDPVFQPLPKQESKAFSALFFIYMPKHLEILAQFTVMAQQMLLPNESKFPHTALDETVYNSIQESVKIPKHPHAFKADMNQYYNKYSQFDSTSRETLKIKSTGAIPDRVGSSDVMKYHDKSEGVWYPDDFHPIIAWDGGKFKFDQIGHFFNPFDRACHKDITDYFTEKSLDASLQWVMPQYGEETSLSRGNQSITFQNKKPAWLKKNQWLEMSSLRAFPNQQLRNICRVLSDRILPFSHPSVQAIITLALYHIGDVSADNKLLWKNDQYFGDFFKAIEEELSEIADELSTKPREYRSLLLFIDLSSYMIQWNPSCQYISRKFVSTLKTWMTDLDQQMSNADQKHAVEIRMKKALFCKYAILCYAKGKLNREDASEIVKFIFLSHKDDGIVDERNSISEELDILKIKSQQVICSRIVDIIVEARRNSYAMFTNAIKLIIHSTPEALQWKPFYVGETEIRYLTSVFEAWSLDNDLYTLNLANGILLFNGKPILQLPVSILEHQLYDRSFHKTNFEICSSKGVFKTIMPTNGYTYTFELCGEELTINEIDSKQVNLQLLEPQGAWSNELPERLLEMHSHWYCYQKGIILLRGKIFHQRNVYFAIKKDTNGESWTCFQIPLHLHGNIWDKFCDESLNLNEFDKLITDSQLATNFEKFEDTKFIHVYLSKEGTKIIELPRFKLKFQWRNSSTVIESLDYTSYVISPCQQLDDTLIGFKRYLLLECNTDGYKHTKVIIPAGKVTKYQDGQGGVDVVGDDKCDYDWSVFSYDIHPRLQCLQASSIEARLQLAELYAATGSLLPEMRMRMTGEEKAMQLLRRCWTNRPLEVNDYVRLENLSKLCQHTPGLILLSYEIGKSSLQTAFLHQTDDTKIEFPVDASNNYVQRKLPWNIRSTLTSDEEFRVFGRNHSFSADMYTFPITDQTCQNIVKSGIDGIAKFEKQLRTFLLAIKKRQDLIDLNDGKEGLLLKKSMISDLSESNRIYNGMIEFEVDTGLLLKIPDLMSQIIKKRVMLENYLIETIKKPLLNNANVHKAIYFKVLRAVNISPKLCLEDLMKAARSINCLKNFNPFLSKIDLDILNLELLTWLEFCVLEDKMYRLTILCKNIAKINAFKIVKELRTVRVWSVKEFPHWLVFEALARLQIRPLQYSVASSIIKGIDKTGVSPIMQLNMGEGKTRVILPMLILHWLNSDKLIRLNFLSALMSEAFTYLHQQLGATLFGCKLHTLPFSRDVNLSNEQALIMYKSLEFCRNFNGVLLITPEHRLSLKLKWYELKLGKKEETCRILAQIDGLPYIDILDECDELLRIKNKLLYACGSPEQPSSGPTRWWILQKLLQSIRENKEIRDLLHLDGVALWKRRKINSSGVFKEFRIVEGEEFESIKRDVYKMLYADIIKEPPFQLRCISKCGLNFKDTFFVNFVTNADFDAELPSEIKNSIVTDFLLSLRGFLASDILIHCLFKRNRVDYGIKRPSKKRMAVPFHASESPAPRAEFAQPDCASVFTFLSYYYDGLSREQVVEAFNALLSVGEIAQKSIYQIWFDLSKSSIIEDSCEDKLDSVVKIDLSNYMLVTLLVKYYRYNTATINYWLESVVLPVETMHFPRRLEATSWDIATNSSKKVAGFSGTNDSKMLLPTSLSWTDSNEIELKATDGKMIHLISKYSSFYVLPKKLDVSNQTKNNFMHWMDILDTVIDLSKNCGTYLAALIDSGALMAGTANKDVAIYLAERLDPDIFQGVVYFDLNQWWVRDGLGREWPKHASPIHEQDAFVYFDESRCRGSDMKLKINAEAVLTLGPNMCKDKLMQAAGRMRQLESGQKLLIIAPDDVITKIRSTNNLCSSGEIKPDNILKWVLSNTVANTSDWMLEWGVQGAQYLNKLDNSDLAHLPDMSDLQQMYGHKFSKQAIPDIWKNLRGSILSQKNSKRPTTIGAEILSRIDERLKKYSADITIKHSSLEDECERQFEKEVELEEIPEHQVPSQQPRVETDWDVSRVVSCSDLKMLISVAGLKSQSLASFIGTHVFFKGNPIKKSIVFSWPDNVYGTDNFYQACKTNISSLNDYLRHVNSFLLYASGDVLLLSEREADRVLQYSWEGKEMAYATLVNLTYACKKRYKNYIYFQTPKLVSWSLTETTIAALQFFQGISTFDLDERKTAIKQILNNDLSKSAAFIFSSMRGLKMNYQYSDLDEICVTAISNKD